MVTFRSSALCILLPVILILHQHAVICESASSLQQEIERSVNHFKLKLHTTIEEARIRKRRNNAYSVHIDGSRGEILQLPVALANESDLRVRGRTCDDQGLAAGAGILS